MRHRCTAVGVLAAVVALGGAACEQNKSANPLSPSVAGPIPGVNITAPRPLEPSPGATLTVGGDRTTLIIENPDTSGVRPLWMELQVAADAGFQRIVHQVSRLALDESGRTKYVLPAPLAAGHTYFWRIRAVDGANSGPYSAVVSFSVVNPVVIEAPVPIGPSGLITTNAPVFTVENPKVTGPAGTIAIRFEVSRTPDPAKIDAVVTVAPGADGTATMTLGNLPYDQEVFWRAQATDGKATSPFSPVMTFRTPAAPPSDPPPSDPPPSDPPPSNPPPSDPPPPTGPVGGQRTISPDEALSIIRRVHDAEGWDLGSRSTRQSRIEFFFRAMAVVHYGHPLYNPRGPDPNWCVKDAGGGRPPSDDVMVRCNTREAWDTVGSAGADGYRFHLDGIGRLSSSQNVYPPPRSALP